MHHHILLQLVRREADASGDERKYLSGLTDDLTSIAGESIPLDDTRAAAMGLRDYLDDYLVSRNLVQHVRMGDRREGEPGAADRADQSAPRLSPALARPLDMRWRVSQLAEAPRAPASTSPTPDRRP